LHDALPIWRILPVRATTNAARKTRPPSAAWRASRFWQRIRRQCGGRFPLRDHGAGGDHPRGRRTLRPLRSDIASWILGAFFLNGLISIAFSLLYSQLLLFLRTIPARCSSGRRSAISASPRGSARTAP